MNGYVRLEKNPLVRAVPLEIKKYFMMAGANLGSRSVTAVYSNIGILKFPEEYKAYNRSVWNLCKYEFSAALFLFLWRPDGAWIYVQDTG